MKLEELKDILTAKDIQEYLGIGRVQTYDLLKRGEFPVRKIGRAIRIPKKPFVEWLNQNELKV